MKVLGPEYFDFAFHATRAGDPSALRVYNDYGFENDSPEAEARRRALLNLLDGLLKRKVPIDAVGLQSHLALTDRFNQKLYRNFLNEISARGLKILITEFDVNDKSGPADPAVRDQLVADYYARFLDVALDETKVIEFATWGLSDRYTWLSPAYDPHFGRADGLPCRPLPFDDEFRPTLAYTATVNALRHAPFRPLATFQVEHSAQT
jgi:endo-1,4-beta-xylanase